MEAAGDIEVRLCDFAGEERSGVRSSRSRGFEIAVIAPSWVAPVGVEIELAWELWGKLAAGGPTGIE